MISKKAAMTVLGGFAVALVFTLSVTTLGKSAISEMAGLAIAQSASKWNSVKDASQGDGLSSGVMATGSYMFNGLTFDRMRSAPASDANAGTGFQGMISLLYNGSTYDRPRGGLAADASAVTGLVNNAQMGFNGTTYDRVRALGDNGTNPTVGKLTTLPCVVNTGTVTWTTLRVAPLTCHTNGLLGTYLNYQSDSASTGTWQAWTGGPHQGLTVTNSQTTGAADTAVTVTLAATANKRGHVYKVTGRCAAGSAALSITVGGTTVWSTPATAVGTANFAEEWGVPLAGNVNSAMVITLSTCGVGNAGTLMVQADIG